MAEGISLYLANKLLDHVCRGVAYTPPTTVYFQAHVGAPGAAMTANRASNTTRVPVPFSAASAGQINISGAPEHVLGGSDLITHGSFWDAASGGNPLWSVVAAASKGGSPGDIIRVSTAALGLSPIAS
ncbi:head protein [Mycobacterium phage Saguaro]|uniref:Uncharacterized protein n=1 Tax=Mycobacterium phage Saguaro TaxID=2315616 RepID=A0A386KA15_9CAUD|nr:head protein [Mycobacterium phage Saguaro]AYD82029.1 hypothetical protein SEA_SAGUARO_34 [Mycobacterium phage Saguaro]